MKELKTMKVNEIKSIARAMGIKGWWDMKKAQLIEAIENHQQTEPLVEDEVIIKESISEESKVTSETTQIKEDININKDEENVPEAKNEAHRKNQKRLLTYKGKTQSLNAWAKDFGIRHQVLYYRIVIKGWDIEKAFETPFKKPTEKEVI